MTAKFDAFVTALRALCREHGVQIGTQGYDGLYVTDFVPPTDPHYLKNFDEDPIVYGHIEDGTDGD